ncbi:hypothetical protein EMCRGX_G032377 [Ephydatia muelleri]
MDRANLAFDQTRSHKNLRITGGFLANGLGITRPDWQYAIDIYEDMKQEEEEERALEEEALRQQNLNRIDDLESQKTSHEPQ